MISVVLFFRQLVSRLAHASTATNRKIFFLIFLYVLVFIHAFDLEVGGGEPLAEPGLAREGIVGGEAVTDDGGSGDADRFEDDAVPAEAFVVVDLVQFALLIAIGDRVRGNRNVVVVMDEPVGLYPDVASRVARSRNLLELRLLVANNDVDASSGAVGTGCTSDTVGAGL